MKNRIVRVESFEVKTPLPKSFSLGAMTISYREYSIVRLYDAEGHCGSAYALTRNAPISAVIKKMMSPAIEDVALEDYKAAYEKIIASNYFLGSSGIFWRAISLIDCAYFDLLARSQEKPMWQVISPKQSAFKTMLVGGYPLPDVTYESFRKEMEFLNSFQPDAIKFGSTANYLEDAKRLGWAREVLPFDVPVMIDTYCIGTKQEEVYEQVKEWEKYNCGWIEDPFMFDDNAGFRKLKKATTVPIAAGDEQSCYFQYEQKLQEGTLDILRLDAAVCGGIHAFLNICEMADRYNVPVATHVYPHLHIHLAMAVPSVQWAEYIIPPLGLESIELLWQSQIDYDKGLQTPKGIGNGILWDEEKVNQYRIN